MSFLLMLLLTLASHCDGETPAMKLVLTDKALQYGTQVGAKLLCQRIRDIDIPEQSGSIRGTSVLGTVYYFLDNISVVQCVSPQPSAHFDEEHTGLKMEVDIDGITVSGKWRANGGLIHDSGEFTVQLTDVYMNYGVTLGADSEGRLTVGNNFCYAGIGDLTINIDSWELQPFVSDYADTVKSQIEQQMCPLYKQAVQSVQSQLAAMSLSISVDPKFPNVVVEVPLTSAPDVLSSSLGLDCKGEFYYAQNHTEPKFLAKPFVLTPQSNYMVQFGFSEFAVNSASYVYSSFIQAQINDSMIPKTSPVRLNTTSFGMFIPQLPKMFPDMLMELQVDAGKVPMFSFVSDKVEVDALATVKAFAVCPNKTLVPLFKLSVDANISLKVSFSQGKVKGSTTVSNFTMALVSSEVGEFQIARLESVVKMAVKMVVLPQVNAILSRGLAIPSLHNIQLVDPVVLVKEGFVVIASNVTIGLGG